MPPVVGIDFGTSKSCVAIFRDDEIEIISNEHGDGTTPSYVAFANNRRSIGAAAAEKCLSNPDNTILDVKRLMRPFDTLSLEQNHLVRFFNIEKDSLKDKTIVRVNKFKDDSRTFTLEEIAAMVVGKLKSAVENHLGLPPSSDIDCVVTVPASFDTQQCQSIIDACTIAGFRVLRTVSESTAAAMAYHVCLASWPKVKPSATTVVISCGAGFTSVSLVDDEVDDGDRILQVLSTSGIMCGGRDIDQRLLEFLANDFDSTHNSRLRLNPKAYSRLQKAAEKVKRALSSSDSTTISIEKLHEGKDYLKTLTRREFEACCVTVFHEIKKFIHRTLLPFDKSTIGEVLLVGGLTRLPHIQRIASEYFGSRFQGINRSINPDEAAAVGASVVGASLSDRSYSNNTRNFLFIDAIPMSVRVDRDGTAGSVVLPKGSTVPNKKSRTFTSEVEYDKCIRCSIYQGDCGDVRWNLLICRLELQRILPRSTGSPTFRLTVEIDQNFHISAELAQITPNGTVLKKTHQSAAIFPMEGIPRLKAKAEAMILEDEKDSQRAVLISQLESAVFDLQDKYKSLILDRSLDELQNEPWRSIESKVEGVSKWLEGHPHAELDAYQKPLSFLEKLSQSLSNLELAKVSDAGIASPFDSADSACNSGGETPFISDPVHDTTNGLTLAESDEDLGGEPVADSVGAELAFMDVLQLRPEVDAISKETSPAQPNVSPKASSTEKATVPPPPTSPFQSSEARLSTFFGEISSGLKTKYTDQDLQDISTILKLMGRQSWSDVPRLYTVLRNIGELHLLDDFIELGVTDIFFPFSATSLPEKLSPTVRARFVDAQNMVFTVALQLERGPERRHATFGRDDILPFEVTARLGSGGYGHVDKVVSLLSHKEYARKTFRRKKMFSREKEGIKSFKNELNILKRVQHAHCVELVSVPLVFLIFYS
jgi:L1 cell adhesion molecule like protein